LVSNLAIHPDFWADDGQPYTRLMRDQIGLLLKLDIRPSDKILELGFGLGHTLAFNGGTSFYGKNLWD
jgi:hypothetical protein